MITKWSFKKTNSYFETLRTKLVKKIIIKYLLCNLNTLQNFGGSGSFSFNFFSFSQIYIFLSVMMTCLDYGTLGMQEIGDPTLANGVYSETVLVPCTLIKWDIGNLHR